MQSAEEYIHLFCVAVGNKVCLAFFGLEIDWNFLCILAVCSLNIFDYFFNRNLCACIFYEEINLCFNRNGLLWSNLLWSNLLWSCFLNRSLFNGFCFLNSFNLYIFCLCGFSLLCSCSNSLSRLSLCNSLFTGSSLTGAVFAGAVFAVVFFVVAIINPSFKVIKYCRNKSFIFCKYYTFQSKMSINCTKIRRLIHICEK